MSKAKPGDLVEVWERTADEFLRFVVTDVDDVEGKPHAYFGIIASWPLSQVHVVKTAEEL